MYRNRNTIDPAPKQSSIANISSYIPLMATPTSDDIHSSTKLLANTTSGIQNLMNSSKTNTNRDSKRGRTIYQPKGTTAYTVGSNDTLEKIALHFNLIPSELLQLNKLNSRIVFPGQTIYVPEASFSSIDNKQQVSAAITIKSPSSTLKAKDDDAFVLNDRRLSSESSPLVSQQDIGHVVWSMTRQPTAKPGHVQRLKSEPSSECEASSRTIEDRLKTVQQDNHKQVRQIKKSLSIEENQQLDDECLQRFIKLNVRLMTEDHKNVAGTLLVTPNAVMFDPDVLDQLVKEYGIDKYGLIIRMDLLAGIALYEDIAMYEHEATLREEEKRKMCHSTSIKGLEQAATLVSNNDEDDIHDIMSLLLDKIEKELEDAPTDPSRVLFDISSISSRRKSSEKQILKNEDLFQSSDDHQHSIGILVDIDDIPLHTCHLENCIPADQYNKRFGEIDKLLQQQHDMHVTPHAIENPYYLCIKTSILLKDNLSIQDKNDRTSIDYVYGKKELEHEYWFSVPKEKIDHLYAFFLRWSPERAICSLSDDSHSDNNISLNQANRYSSRTQSKQNVISSAQGFVLLANDDPELTDDYLLSNDKNKNTSNSQTTITSHDRSTQSRKQHYLKRQNTLLKEWEIISVDEIYRRINATQTNNANSSNFGIPPPKLLQPSTLIDEEKSKSILLELPPRVHGLNWQILFSTEANGFSLNQLYRRSMQVDVDNPSLLIVKDIEQNIFGAYVSQQLMISEGFYGTGETFLFTFHPQFRVFHWTGNNQFFIKGDVKALGLGSGEGTYGLWLDADLYHGRTCPSKTFNNTRLSSKEDFIIASIELWTFID
ncbi:unnamed protein product [Rotaria socialis]|uniref:Oxidation resistance protein 1 n=1 Tax=Rotaria socialis TaxID=392032 RepID=A0A818CVN8_9BILA|nr:unnamed protein product [Rotaria socialis]